MIPDGSSVPILVGLGFYRGTLDDIAQCDINLCVDLCPAPHSAHELPGVTPPELTASHSLALPAPLLPCSLSADWVFWVPADPHPGAARAWLPGRAGRVFGPSVRGGAPLVHLLRRPRRGQWRGTPQPGCTAWQRWPAAAARAGTAEAMFMSGSADGLMWFGGDPEVHVSRDARNFVQWVGGCLRPWIETGVCLQSRGARASRRDGWR